MKDLYIKKGYCTECLFGKVNSTCFKEQEKFFKTKKEAKCPKLGYIYASIAECYLEKKRKERNYL